VTLDWNTPLFHQEYYGHCSRDGLEDPSDGCEDSVVEYDETFMPIARYISIKSIMAIAAGMGWKIHQMDVKIVFLNSLIEEEIYIE
jgi:hypothetical protein